MLLFSVSTEQRGPHCKELVMLVSQELEVYIVGAIKGNVFNKTILSFKSFLKSFALLYL